MSAADSYYAVRAERQRMHSDLDKLARRMMGMAQRAAREGWGRNADAAQRCLWERIDQGNQLTMALCSLPTFDADDSDAAMMAAERAAFERFWRAERAALEVL